MDRKHYNELILLSQKMYDSATDQLKEYLENKYADAGADTMEQQMEDYLFVTEETSAYLLGNAIALLDPASQEEEIKTFTETLRRVIARQMQKAGGDLPPS